MRYHALHIILTLAVLDTFWHITRFERIALRIISGNNPALEKR